MSTGIDQGRPVFFWIFNLKKDKNNNIIQGKKNLFAILITIKFFSSKKSNIKNLHNMQFIKNITFFLPLNVVFYL